MKNLLILLTILFPIITQAQDSSVLLEKARGLIEENKYESAFNLLEDADPKNEDPDVFLLKEEIVLNYFTSSIGHQFFGLKDLEPGEDIMDYRGKEGSFTLIPLNVDSILNRLISKYPEKCELYYGLGNYYYEVHLKYGGQWKMSDDDLLPLIRSNFSRSIELGCADFLPHYVLGYLDLVESDPDGAIAHFKRSISLNPNYSSARYNLAYVYMNRNEPDSALPHALSAYQTYEDPIYQADAARMAGYLYMDLKQDHMALEYFEKANQIDPNNYYTLKPLLDLYLSLENEKYKDLTDQFYELDPTNPTIHNDLGVIYSSNNKQPELIAFYNRQLEKSIGDPEQKASLHFFLGRAQMDSDPNEAKKNLTLARENFKEVFEEDHPVFDVIDKGLEKLSDE